MGSKVTEKSPKASKVEKTPKKEKSEDKLKVKTPKTPKTPKDKKEKKEKKGKKEKKEKKAKKVESSDSEAEEKTPKEEKAASPAPEKEESSASESEAEVATEAATTEEVAETETGTKRSAEDSEVPEESEAKKQKVEDGPTTVFVGGLSWSVDNDWLRDEMKECGEIVDVRVITDRATGRSKGFAYVEFASHEGAKNAMEMAGKEIDGRAIRVDFSEAKPAAKKPERTYESQNNEPSDTLFIGNLSFNSNEDSVRAAFAECGEVLSVRLPTDRETGRPKGFGYIQFASIDAAKAAMQWNGSDLDGRNIRLDFAAARKDDGGDRRSSFGGRGGSRGGRGGPRGGGRGGPRGGGRGGFSSNRGGVGEFSGTKITFD